MFNNLIRRKEMKASSLMIGDWVYYNTCDPKPIKVESILNRAINIEPNGTTVLDENAIAPIPITEEILEKNIDTEYEHYENGHAIYGIGKYPKSIEITWFAKGGAEWTINGDEYGIMELCYVHELQHVLKLYGIEKEVII